MAAVPGVLRAATGTAKLQTVTSEARALGAQTSIAVLHEDIAIAGQAARAATAELQLVDELMSLYRDSSEVSQLNRDGRLPAPHAYMRQVLEEAHDLSVRSGGAFDVTVQPLWKLYSKCKAEGRLPTDDELADARAKIGYEKLRLSETGVQFAEAGMALTLNGIAQGFAADKAIAALKKHGVEHALVNTGEVAPLGSNAEGKSWTAGIQHPRRKDAFAGIVQLGRRCLATSGDYATHFTPDYLHHHIFDPATGDSPAELASASVLAPRAALADALATTIMVMGAERGLELVRQYQGVDALLIRKDQTQLITGNFPRLEAGGR